MPPARDETATVTPSVGTRGAHYKVNTSALPPTMVLSVADRPRSSSMVGGAGAEAATVVREVLPVNGTSGV